MEDRNGRTLTNTNDSCLLLQVMPLSDLLLDFVQVEVGALVNGFLLNLVLLLLLLLLFSSRESVPQLVIVVFVIAFSNALLLGNLRSRRNRTSNAVFYVMNS